MTNALSAAHEYVRRGWSVVPLHGVTEDGFCRCRAGRTCPPKNRGKHPSLGNAWHERALSSGPDVQAWWEDRPHDNLGVLTGAGSGLFVFDVDGAAGVQSLTAMATEHGAMPATRIIRTGSGGLHYYFKHPGHFVVHNSSGWLGKGIDVRGAGGQVVAPPSISGLGAYEVIADHEVAQAPPWLLELVAEHARHIEDGRKAEVVTAERVDVEFLPPVIETLRSQLIGDGGRHQHFYALVAACFENGYTQGQAVTIAAPWCAAVGKFAGRVEAEVARSWAKLSAASEKAEAWLGPAPASRATTGPVPAAPPGVVAVPAGDAEGATGADVAGVEGEAEELTPSWAPVDLTAILEGTYVPELPALLERTDGAFLLYPGRVHSFHGESESGKSLLAQHAAERVLGTGGSVAYVDFEADAGAVVGRLLELGAPAEALQDSFAYHRPDVDPRRFPHEREHFAALASGAWDLIVIDGVTDALGVWGAGSNDNDEIAAFMRHFPRLLARRTGAAVVLVDHVTKDSESRGRFAVGGQAKLNALDGAAYTIEIADALGRGLRGTIVMSVAKDRPGGVRPSCGTFRRDRTQEAARVVIDSSAGEGIEVTVEPPRSHVGDEPKPFRPTVMMERVSRAIEESTTHLSQKAIRTLVRGKTDAIVGALDLLEAEGFVVNEGTERASKYRHERPYRQVEDPASDSYLGWIPAAPDPSSGPPVPSGPPAVPATGRTAVPDPVHPLGGRGPIVAPESGEAVPGGPLGETGTVTGPEALTEIVDVACRSCFAPVPSDVARLYGGRCPKCARNAGLEVSS